MKRYFLMLACAALTFASCDELKDQTTPDLGGNDKENEVTPGPTPSPELTPDAQKAKMQTVGEEILELCPSDDFQHLAQVAEDFSTFFEGVETYDLSELEDWYYEQMEAAYTESEKQTIKKNTVTNDYKMAIVVYLANHTGLFTFGEDKVTVSDYKGTKAVFSLNGNQYEAEISTSGKVTDALFVSQSYDKQYDQNGYYNNTSGEYVETENPVDIIYNRESRLKVGVPEKVIIDLKENGSSLAKITAEFQTAFSKEGYDLTTDAFAVSYKAEINGYELEANNISYNGTSGNAEVSYSLKKDGTTIFKTAASAKVKIAVNEKTEEWDSYEYSYTVVEATKADNIALGLDIMGQIQVVGTFSDVIKAQSVIGNLYNALEEENMSSAENYLKDLNDMLELGVYYDNGSNRQATVEIELSEWNDGSYTYHELMPVLVFSDDSRYSIEDFFSQEAFGSLIDSAYALADSYTELFGYFISQEDVQVPDEGHVSGPGA